MLTGIIQQSLSGFYDVISEGQLYRTRARGNFRQKKIKPMVGDVVQFDVTQEDQGYILALEKRKNVLVRPPVANVDIAIVVTAVKQPDFSTNLLDRQLIALEKQSIRPVIYFSKTDLVDDQNELIKLTQIAEYYQSIGYQTLLPQKTFDDASLAILTRLINNKITVVMGQTGAGKSTLLNHLAPELQLETGEISQALKRGKHTTRKVSLKNVNGSLIADTPGFSSYEAFDMTVNELSELFPEFVAISQQCKFRGCLHLKEPGCAVKAALTNGTILNSRYENYVLFHDLIVKQKPIYNKKK